jgi:hypothetical protein
LTYGGENFRHLVLKFLVIYRFLPWRYDFSCVSVKSGVFLRAMRAIDDIDIDSREVRRLLGNVSKMWLDRRLNPKSPQYDPDFPQPYQYADGGRRHWSRNEILAYRERMRRIMTERRLARRQAASSEYLGRPGE